MARPARLWGRPQSAAHSPPWGDALVLLGLGGLLYVGVRLAFNAPRIVAGPPITLDPWVLPWYALLSLKRMAAAYLLSVLFSLVYGYLAARNRRAEVLLVPLLDVLQSVPILSFLPVVMLSFSAVLPLNLAAELASIVLIFTSQVWNLTFAWYQSLRTVPGELHEASTIFQFSGWLRFRTLEWPFGIVSFIWNSMMGWAGGWFFLMAAEIFSVGGSGTALHQEFRLPGLGAYLREAANQGNVPAILWGLGALVLLIVLLDQFVWRPLLAWAERFKLATVEVENPPSAWFYDVLSTSRLNTWLKTRVLDPLSERMDDWLLKWFPWHNTSTAAKPGRTWGRYLLGALGSLVLLYVAYQAVQMLASVSLRQWGTVGLGVLCTLARVLCALLLALAWTLPLGVLIGTNARLAAWLQPLVQIAASVPATALFPILLLAVLQSPGGMSLGAVFLMLMGTQWYLLFNIIAGASAIPQDLKYTSALLQLGFWQRWRTLILPALFPYIITGAITASGGAWNASIVAEYMVFGGQTLTTTGIGGAITEATARGDYPMLLASTLSMVATVVLVNRLVWRRLYRLAEERYTIG